MEHSHTLVQLTKNRRLRIMKSTRVSFPQKFRLMAPIVTVYTANSVLLGLSWDFLFDHIRHMDHYRQIDLEIFTTRMRSQTVSHSPESHPSAITCVQCAWSLVWMNLHSYVNCRAPFAERLLPSALARGY